MKRGKAIDKIMADLQLSDRYLDYVVQTLGRLGCDENLDLDTVAAVEQVIRNDMR